MTSWLGVKVAGCASYRDVVASVTPGAWVLIQPDPINPHDENAVAVRLLDGPLATRSRRPIAGYVPAHVAQRLDVPAAGVRGDVTAVREHDGQVVGFDVRFLVVRLDADQPDPYAVDAWLLTSPKPSRYLAGRSIDTLENQDG